MNCEQRIPMICCKQFCHEVTKMLEEKPWILEVPASGDIPVAISERLSKRGIEHLSECDKCAEYLGDIVPAAAEPVAAFA